AVEYTTGRWALRWRGSAGRSARSTFAGDRDRGYGERARGLEDGGAGGQRRAGGNDVVDEQDPSTADRSGVVRAGAELECAVDVGGALVPSELELGGGCPRSFERPDHRQLEMTTGHGSDERRLVVAPMPLALGMDRDGHDEVRTDAGLRPAA